MGTIQTTIQNQIAYLEFSHPAGNSFPSEQLKAFCEALEKLGKDNTIKVIIIKSGGDSAFCAGAYFNELLEIDNAEDGIKFFSGFASVINSMRKCPKIIIGRIQGKAVGGGIGLAAACDYTLATDSALIKLSELTIGIGPFVIAPAVERKIGLSAYSELALSAKEWKSAQWANEKGLYAETFKTIPELDHAVEEMAQNLASFSLESLEALKKSFWENCNHWDTLLYERAAISGNLIMTEYAKDALSAIKKKL